MNQRPQRPIGGARHWLRHSLAARVTAIFMLIVALAAAGLGTYLYRAFVDEIERRDDIQLLGKLRQVQIVLGRPGAAELVRNHPDFFRDTMSGQENSLVRIVAPGAAGQGAAGQGAWGRDAMGLTRMGLADMGLTGSGLADTVLADINPAGERYPVPVVHRASGASPDRAAIADWTGSHGAPGRVVAAAARLGDATVTVIVARLYGERAAMFASYRHRIAAAAAVSALAAALCAALMLHRGLRPLRVVAAHAALVRPGTLARRLAPGDAPSELQPLVDALNAMLARLQDGYARLSGFSADLAHEFRTPITNLLGQSQVLLAQPRSVAEYEQLLASNIEELERLARMIESMLFLARAGQEDVLPARQPLAALDELRKVADFFEGMAEEQGVRIACTGDAVVRADPALLRRALANLVSNAVRHAEPGSTIELAARQCNGVTELTVTNTGAPIAPEHLPHLFDRFYRADPARGNADGSTGLGLAIVSAIMVLHGGTATVDAEGGCTRFVLGFA